MSNPHALGSATAGPSGPVARGTIDKDSCSSLDDPLSLAPSSPTHPFLDHPAPHHTLHPHTRPHTADLDMPMFSLRGLFRRGASSTSFTGPSTATVPYSTFNHGARAQSEPLPALDEDVEMGPAHNRYDTQHTTPITKNAIDALAEASEEESDTRPRAPSPVPTDVYDPDSQDVMADILQRGVKIRDFAYVNRPPPTPSSPSSSDPDPYPLNKNISHRGKTLRRLLDMGWIKQAEVDARAHPMDLEDLRQHDLRPHYPWRPFRWTSIPCLENRTDMARARTGLFNQLDRIRASSESAAQRRRIEQAQAEVLLRRYEELLRLQREQIERAELAHENRRLAGLVGGGSPGRNKRSLDDDDDENVMSDDTDTGSPRKRRRTPECTPTEPASSRRTRSPSPSLPRAAALVRPAIYPEAASIIESSAQTASQPRPVVAPPRADTPPLDAEAVRREQEHAQQQAGQTPERRGAKLVHPRERKAMKRQLSRTQTFAQL
ncbi:hypothetical protein BJ912DRAFT_975987 [Pholiota molesta]|nr:hypothetical protein BJ912DRAFT_975987 [Pholiota molesta]